jgi:hypothetical protein
MRGLPVSPSVTGTGTSAGKDPARHDVKEDC